MMLQCGQTLMTVPQLKAACETCKYLLPAEASASSPAAGRPAAQSATDPRPSVAKLAEEAKPRPSNLDSSKATHKAEAARAVAKSQAREQVSRMASIQRIQQRKAAKEQQAMLQDLAAVAALEARERRDALGKALPGACSSQVALESTNLDRTCSAMEEAPMQVCMEGFGSLQMLDHDCDYALSVLDCTSGSAGLRCVDHLTHSSALGWVPRNSALPASSLPVSSAAATWLRAARLAIRASNFAWRDCSWGCCCDSSPASSA